MSAVISDSTMMLALDALEKVSQPLREWAMTHMGPDDPERMAEAMVYVEAIKELYAGLTGEPVNEDK